jgi:hypothetical protein
MRKLCWRFIPILVLSISTTAIAKPPATSSGEIQEKLFEWCGGFFASGTDKNPIERPNGSIPFNMKDQEVPPDLVTPTQIVHQLPPEIEKYQGTWILPSAVETSSIIVFVERLAPKEMTLVLLIKTAGETASRRYRLIRIGGRFSDTEPWPKGQPALIAQVSPRGEALGLDLIGYPPRWGAEPDGEPRGESHPFCFISSKHY